MTHRRNRILVLSLLVSYSLAGRSLAEPPIQASESHLDRFPRDRWMQYADVTEAGFSPKALARAETFWRNRDSSAFMVVSGGAVVAAWGEIDRRFYCHSVRKSFLNALYGIYADQIDLSATLAELRIDDRLPLTDAEKQARVVDLISSRSGVYHEAAAEPDTMSKNRPERGSHPPGSHWWYNNWDFNAAGVIFEQQTGQGIFEAFGRSIAEPIGMQDYRVSDGFYHYERRKSLHPGYMFRMSTRDLARFGLLYARSGRWQDRQVMTESWVRESTRSHSPVDMGAKYGSGYGYMWWIEDEGFTARGSGGHILAVYPERDLVMVIRADTFHDRTMPVRAAMKLFERVLKAGGGPRAEAPELVPMPPAPKAPKPAIELSAEALAAYPTELETDSGRAVVIAASEGGLTLDYGFGAFRLEPQSPTRFITEDSRDPVLFELDSAGRVQTVWLEPLCYLEAAAAVQQGDVETAVAWVRRAVEKFPDSSRAHLNLARALYGTGHSGDAWLHVEKALQLDPENQRASELRKVLLLDRIKWIALIGVLGLGGAVWLRIRKGRKAKDLP